MAKQQVFNPYLPNYEYVPDGEPHVFDGRLYVFGSHDRFGGKKFCMNDYVAWSAPVDDLSDWRYEGVIYRKVQDPANPDGEQSMYAPDVAQGPDGRYYLYYGLADQFKLNVAVCDSPAGAYEYYGFVTHPDGTAWGEREGDIMPFDPGIMVDDDGRIHLYAGQGPINPTHAKFAGKRHTRDSAFYVELDSDMKTMKGEPKKILPNCAESKGTGFEQHEFFEANSIRKFNGKYYFIYSSIQSHELCYAVSDQPDEGFVYGGTLHSNGDIGIDEFFPNAWFAGTDKRIKAYIGNNHGSIVEIKGHYYIFGHRHTNASQFSRQGVAEEIFMDSDGHFAQAEMTSCGLNGGPLRGIGSYPAAIACNLRSKKGACFSMGINQNKKHPRLTQEGPDRECDPEQYIANMRDGALAAFKYFDFESEKPEKITVLVRGRATGTLYVYTDEKQALSAATAKVDEKSGMPAARIKVDAPLGAPAASISVDLIGSTWTHVDAPLSVSGEKTPLFFVYRGSGAIDLKEFRLA